MRLPIFAGKKKSYSVCVQNYCFTCARRSLSSPPPHPCSITHTANIFKSLFLTTLANTRVGVGHNQYLYMQYSPSYDNQVGPTKPHKKLLCILNVLFLSGFFRLAIPMPLLGPHAGLQSKYCNCFRPPAQAGEPPHYFLFPKPFRRPLYRDCQSKRFLYSLIFHLAFMNTPLQGYVQ